MENKSQNKKTERKAIEIAIKWLKNKYHKQPIEQNSQAHYDLQVGKMCVEVKGSNRNSEYPPYIWLNKKEYEFASQNLDNYSLLVVNIKTGKVLECDQDYIYSNSKKKIKYLVSLGKKRVGSNSLPKDIIKQSKNSKTKQTKEHILAYKRQWIKKHRHLPKGGYALK